MESGKSRQTAVALAIALLFYLGSYLWIRAHSWSNAAVIPKTSKLEPSVLLGVGEADMPGYLNPARHTPRQQRIATKIKVARVIYAPLIWLDGKITGAEIITSADTFTAPPRPLRSACAYHCPKWIPSARQSPSPDPLQHSPHDRTVSPAGSDLRMAAPSCRTSAHQPCV